MEGQGYVDPLLDVLFEREIRALDDCLKTLIENNHALGNPNHGFLYGGKFHTRLAPVQQRQATKKILHEDLRDRGRQYLADVRILEAERLRLSHGLNWLLRPCSDEQDVRDMLPTMVGAMLPEIAPLKRTREAGWLFKDQPLQHHQFQETVNLLEFYVSNRIL